MVYILSDVVPTAYCLGNHLKVWECWTFLALFDELSGLLILTNQINDRSFLVYGKVTLCVNFTWIFVASCWHVLTFICFAWVLLSFNTKHWKTLYLYILHFIQPEKCGTFAQTFKHQSYVFTCFSHYSLVHWLTKLNHKNIAVHHEKDQNLRVLQLKLTKSHWPECTHFSWVSDFSRCSVVQAVRELD